MYEKVICQNCQGNGCGSCHKTGVKFVEVDEIDQRYYDNTIRTIVNLSNNNSQLKKQLEIAVKALRFYNNAGNWAEVDNPNYGINIMMLNEKDTTLVDGKIVGGFIAKMALDELESAGE